MDYYDQSLEEDARDYAACRSDYYLAWAEELKGEDEPA